MNSGILAKLIILAGILLLPLAQVSAATFDNIDTHAKLVNAINTANGNSEADTINITADITLTAALPNITTQIDIISATGHTISGNNAYRIFTVTSGGNLRVDRLALTNGNGGNADGGAIHVTSGQLELRRSVVRNSTTGSGAKSGGGIYVTASAGSPASASISDSSIHNNLAYHEGGGIFLQGQVALTLSRSAVYSNEAKSTSASGGGLVFRNYGDTPAGFTIINSSIFGNKGVGRGAGIYASLNATAGITSVVTLRHVTITGNTTGSTDTTSGAGFYAVNAKVNLQNSIIYGNKRSGDSASNCIFDQIPASGGNAPTLSNNVVGGGSTSSSAPHCTPNSDPADPLLAGPGVHGQGNFFIPRVGSQAIDSIGNADCLPESAGGHQDQRGRNRPFPTGGNCDKGAIEDPGWSPPPPPPPSSPDGGDDGDDGDGGNGGSSSDDEANQAAVAVIRYSPAQSCQTLQPEIVVSKASIGTSCQRVEGSEIGHADVIAAMPSLVVDIWGWVTPGTQVCFRASSGAIKFIDTTAIPRTVADLPAFSEEGGLLCATIDGAGQVALVAGPSAPPVETATLAADKLSDCMVLLQYMLNLRAEPAGEMIAVLPSQVKLTALERADGWFKVDYHGEQGWISAAYVEPEGDCG